MNARDWLLDSGRPFAGRRCAILSMHRLRSSRRSARVAKTECWLDHWDVRGICRSPLLRLPSGLLDPLNQHVSEANQRDLGP
jgi:hypothetical protein